MLNVFSFNNSCTISDCTVVGSAVLGDIFLNFLSYVDVFRNNGLKV